MQLSDLITLAAFLRPQGGPQPSQLAKAPSNVTGLPINSAALNRPAQSDPAQMLASMIAASQAPSEMALQQAKTGVLNRQADFLKQVDLNSIMGGISGAPSPLAPETIAPQLSPSRYAPADTFLKESGTNLKAGGGAVDFVDNWETRNNNFGGLRKPGVVAGPNAGGFQAFSTPEDGISAISRQLDRYAAGATTGAPLNTIRKIVSTWAPPSENPTDTLIARAASVTGFHPDQPLDVGDPNVKAKLIEATIRNEQGGKLPVDPAIISKVAGAAPGQFGGVVPQPPPLSIAPGAGAVNIDPTALAKNRLLLSLGGIQGDPLQGFAQAYYQSPQYLAAAEAAKRWAGVAPDLYKDWNSPSANVALQGQIAGVRATEEARAAYLRPENNPELQAKLQAAKTIAEKQAVLLSAGIDPASPSGQAILRNTIPDTRPEAVQLVDAANLPEPNRGQAITGAIPGNAPTGTMKESRVFLSGTPEEQNALREAGALSRPITTINNVTNPIAAGISKQFSDQAERASASAETIAIIHNARDLLNRGIISGPGADMRAGLQRIGELFGLSADAAANTAAFQSAMGENVLSTVKQLGSGVSISNADREFAKEMAGGNAPLGEASIRRVLDIRESLARQLIDRYNQRAKSLIDSNDEAFKSIAPLMLVKPPGPYGATPSRQDSGPAVQFEYDPASKTLKPVGGR